MISEKDVYVERLESTLRDLYIAVLHPDNVLRGKGLDEALSAVEKLMPEVNIRR